MKTAAIHGPEKQAAVEAAKKDAAQERTGSAAPSRAGKAAKRLRILVAEDVDVNRELVTELLEKRGHTVAAVVDGRAALAALAKQPFDVVLMDEQMPGMDGLEATRAIRKMEASSGKHQIIIGLTGNVAEEDRKRRLEAGMDGAVPKPFDMHVLFQMIEAHSPGTSQIVAASAARAESAPSPAPSSESAAAHLQRAIGNEKLIRSLVKSFLADAPKMLSGIRRAVAQKSAAKLAGAAHAFKGAAANFGESNTVAAARKLEAMGKTGSLSNAEKELRTLEDEFTRLKSELVALQSKKQTAPTRRRK